MPIQKAIHQDTCRCLEWEMEDFTCARCNKLYGSCYGAADKYPELCDFCFKEVAEDNLVPEGTPKFSLGQVVMTQGVQAALEEHPEDKGLQELADIILKRHALGDWCNDGDLDEHDINANEQALKSGGRLFSVYYLKDGTERGTKIYVITEWNRSVTTALLPNEY